MYKGYDASDIFERSSDYQFNQKDFMSNIFKINIKDVGSAVISAVIVAVLTYLAHLTNIANFDWHVVLGLAITVFATSLLKALGTTNDGKFVGVVPIK